jgi:hypothetical protein
VRGAHRSRVAIVRVDNCRLDVPHFGLARTNLRRIPVHKTISSSIQIGSAKQPHAQLTTDAIAAQTRTRATPPVSAHAHATSSETGKLVRAQLPATYATVTGLMPSEHILFEKVVVVTTVCPLLTHPPQHTLCSATQPEWHPTFLPGVPCAHRSSLRFPRLAPCVVPSCCGPSCCGPQAHCAQHRAGHGRGGTEHIAGR